MLCYTILHTYFSQFFCINFKSKNDKPIITTSSFLNMTKNIIQNSKMKLLLAGRIFKTQCGMKPFFHWVQPGPFITPWFMKSIGKSLPRVCFHGLPHYFRGHGTLAEAKSVSSGPSWHDYYSLQRGHREPKACWVGAPQQHCLIFWGTSSTYYTY